MCNTQRTVRGRAHKSGPTRTPQTPRLCPSSAFSSLPRPSGEDDGDGVTKRGRGCGKEGPPPHGSFVDKDGKEEDNDNTDRNGKQKDERDKDVVLVLI